MGLCCVVLCVMGWYGVVEFIHLAAALAVMCMF